MIVFPLGQSQFQFRVNRISARLWFIRDTCACLPFLCMAVTRPDTPLTPLEIHRYMVVETMGSNGTLRRRRPIIALFSMESHFSRNIALY